MQTTQEFQIPVGRVLDVTKELLKLQKRASKISDQVFAFQFATEEKTRLFQANTEEGLLEARYRYRVSHCYSR